MDRLDLSAVALKRGVALGCLALQLVFSACSSDAENGCAGADGGWGAGVGAGAPGALPPGEFPRMIYGDTTMLVQSPSLSELHSNLLFAYGVLYNPTDYAFAALRDAPLGGGQIIYIIDPDVVANPTEEKMDKLDAFLTAVGNHPSVYGFYLYDEPNLSSAITREKFLAVHEHCKAAAPNKPTLTIFAADLSWGSGGGTELLGIADIEAFSYTAYGGCDGNGYCMSYGEYEGLLQGFSAAHDGLEQNNTTAYWPFITAYHKPLCDDSCGFAPPTKSQMEQLIDGAIAIDAKFSNGIIFFLYSGGDYLGIKEVPVIASAVSAINAERIAGSSVFPVRVVTEPNTEASSDPACVGTSPAEMVEMPEGFSIDSTEVTRCQYQAWLNTSPSLEGQDGVCEWNETYVPQCSWPPGDKGNHPVVCVDWCDAHAYCQGVGKHLCGNVGGGASPYDDVSDSQWMKACTAGGQNIYPYGNTHDASNCNGYGKEIADTAEVGSLTTCQSSTGGYEGVFDLSGNVWEWVDSCNGSGGTGGAYCRLLGGSFLGYDAGLLACHYTGPGDLIFKRDFYYDNAGFRCCSQ